MKVNMAAVFSHRIAISLFIISSLTMLLPGCNREPINPEIYLKYCASCHGPKGEGLRSLYPALQGSSYLAQRIDQLPCLVASGVKAVPTAASRSTKMLMPSFNYLDIEDMTDLIIYMHTTWGSEGITPSKQDVEKWLRNCH